jgi:uncharacterized protein YecT (DUF1311 family)
MKLFPIMLAAASSGGALGELDRWIHLDAIQALVHHATAVAAAIFLFAVTARLISYLIPDGHAKQIVIIIDDIVLLAVFSLAGWRLLEYMWVRPHLEGTVEELMQGAPPAPNSIADTAQDLIASCKKLANTRDELDECLERTDVQAKQALDAAAARVTVDMQALDHAGGDKTGVVHGFEAAQSAFFLYREAECRWRRASAANGEGDNIYHACMASLARQRAAQIAEILPK